MKKRETRSPKCKPIMQRFTFHKATHCRASCTHFWCEPHSQIEKQSVKFRCHEAHRHVISCTLADARGAHKDLPESNAMTSRVGGDAMQFRGVGSAAQGACSGPSALLVHAAASGQSLYKRHLGTGKYRVRRSSHENAALLLPFLAWRLHQSDAIEKSRQETCAQCARRRRAGGGAGSSPAAASLLFGMLLFSEQNPSSSCSTGSW